MSVIITGMKELPKSCFSICPLLDGEYGTCQYSDMINTTWDEEQGRPVNCPLKSVKGLLAEISKCSITYPSEEEKLDEAYNQGLVTAMEIIKEYCEAKMEVNADDSN